MIARSKCGTKDLWYYQEEEEEEEEVYFLGTSHYLGITNKLSIESGQI
jgi:hypothetical protein